MRRYVIMDKADIDRVNFDCVVGSKEDVMFYPDDTFVLEFIGECPLVNIEYEGPFLANDIIPILEERFPYEPD
jgi:hypothetical protein